MHRVLPRDAFNDANLLKCIGKLTMMIEDDLIDFITIGYDGEPFDIQQDESDGSTFIANLNFFTKSGEPIRHSRPLNSRELYPLTLHFNDQEYWAFNEDGEFMPSKLAFNKKD